MKRRIAKVVSAGMLAGISLIAGGQTATDSPPANHAAASAVYDLTFSPAGATNGGLRVCLRPEGDRFAAGVTVGPLGPTTVDCSALRLSGGSLSGSLKATVGFDGYLPKDGKPVTHEYAVTATVTGATVRGTYEGVIGAGADGKTQGTVEGVRSAPPDLNGHWVMDLQLENGSGTGTLGPKSYGNRVYPRLFLKDGAFVQSLIYGWGKRAQINYFEAAVTTNALRFDGRALSGALTVLPTGGEPYEFAVEGLAVGTQIGGTFRKRFGGREHPGGPFHGTLAPMAARPLDQAVYYLELHRAVQRHWAEGAFGTNGLQLMVFAPCMAGKFGEGVAYAAAWNHAFHDVDSSGLSLRRDVLTGTLRVGMHPDAYMPPDHERVSATYTIEATVVDGRLLRGAFTGQFKDRRVEGPVFGELLDQPAVPNPVAIHVKMEDGVNGGAPWFRRTWADFTATDGKADRGSLSNNKGGWKGTFKRAEARFEGSTFTATIEGTVDESKGTEKGAYTFKLKGRTVGTELVGACDTYRDGKLTKSGTDFMGGFGPPQ